MFNEIVKTIDWNGNKLEISTGVMARQADGAVLVKMGGSVVLCTSVSAKEPKKDIDFLPLSVQYREMAYAAGKIPGGFFKREGKASERETLVSRLIDRPIRPLFHSSFCHETQVVCTVLSYDPEHNTDILAMIGASAALAISGVPYQAIIAASRVGFIDEQFVLNPSVEEIKKSKLDLVIAGTQTSIMMVESEASILSEEQMLEALRFGHIHLKPIITMIEELVELVGHAKLEVSDLVSKEFINEIHHQIENDIQNALSIIAKNDRLNALEQIHQKLLDKYCGQNENHITQLQLDSAFKSVKANILRSDIINKNIRIDGRAPDAIRQIDCKTSLLPKAHGSSLFTRGETQALVVTTLGSSQDEQIIDSLDGDYKEHFMLNYIFPAYSVGEVGALRAPGRREIGHGKLAWRALKHVMPNKSEFGYSIRVVSEITESNGSSSMATVCGASMALMDAGVPIKNPVAGIAMGLIKHNDKFVVLSDILGDEDALGDMDFKVAGTKDGITALQMDIKIQGVTLEIMEKALSQAKDGRMHILGKMAKEISVHKSEVNSNAPVMANFKINKDKIREVIGPGGKVIREICETTGAKIDISDDGSVTISAANKDKLEVAVQKVKAITFTPEVGAILDGNVVKILESGAFVNYALNKDGFLHISEISNERISTPRDVFSEGSVIQIKILGFDNKGKARLTMKNLNDDVVKTAAPDLQKKPHKPKANHSQDTSLKNKDSSAKEQSVVSERKYFN